MNTEFAAGCATYGGLADEVRELKAQVRLEEQRGNRYRDRHDDVAKQLSAERVKLMRLAMAKCWTNEDGKRFMFLSDIQAALGLPMEDTPSEVTQ